MQILLMQNYKVIMQMRLSPSLLTNTRSSSHPAAAMDDKSVNRAQTGGMPVRFKLVSGLALVSAAG